MINTNRCAVYDLRAYSRIQQGEDKKCDLSIVRDYSSLFITFKIVVW